MLHRPQTVLVFTDSSTQYARIQAQVSLHGFEVMQVKAIREAMQALRDMLVALVLLRVETAAEQLPEFVQRIKRYQPDIPVILLTPATGEFPLSSVLRIGADGALKSPINDQTLSLLFERPYWEALNRLDWWKGVYGNSPS